MYYESGYHIVNRIGYFITEEDYEEGIEYTVELEDLIDGEYQCKGCGDRFDEPEDGCCPNCGSDSFIKGCVDEAEEE
jgi:rubrerythrin